MSLAKKMIQRNNWMNDWKKALNVNFVMGVGGTFDIVSGKTKRAPLWMQICS